MKLTLALILALQEPIPAPDKELVEKYEGLKAVFLKRIVNFYQKASAAVAGLLETSPTGGKAKEFLEDFKKNPRVESAIKILSGLGTEMEPVMEKARMTVLGAYSHYLRPYIGDHLDKAITNIKPVLDTILPAEN